MTTKAVEMKAFGKFEAMALKNRTMGAATKSYQDIDGSPYLYEEKIPADLVQHSGDTLKNIPLQIDLYAKEFVFTDPDGKDLFLDTKFFKDIIINKDEGRDIFKRLYDHEPSRFSIVLFEDDEIIVVHEPEIKHVEMSMIVSGQREFVNRFEKKHNYYLLRNGQRTNLTFKKKKFFKAFNNAEQDKMKAFARESNIKLLNIDDFINLIAHRR